MKNLYILLCALLASLSFVGCQPFSSVEEDSSPLKKSETPTVAQIYTEADIIEIFNADDSHAGYSSNACVAVDDSAYGLIGIVQYTDDEANPCNLAFVNEEGWSYPLGVAIDGGFSISNDSVLTYLGNGKVSFSLIENETKKVFDYTVSYEVEDSNSHFEVSATERQ